MAEEGRGQRHSAPKVAPSWDNFLRVLTPLQGVQNVKKAIAWSSRAWPSFGLHQNSPRQKFSNRENFSSLPTFANKNFSVFNEKISAKGYAPARPKACKVGQSILTDESADRDFSNRKKSLISRLLAPTSPKAQKNHFRMAKMADWI